MTAPTLTFTGGAVVALPADIAWPDQFAWSPIRQASTFALDGAVVVESAEELAWRPITLASGATYGWVRTATVEALHAQYVLGDAPITLALEGQSYSVLFDRSGQGLVCEPLKVRPVDGRPELDWWRVTIPLRTLT